MDNINVNRKIDKISSTACFTLVMLVANFYCISKKSKVTEFVSDS